MFSAFALPIVLPMSRFRFTLYYEFYCCFSNLSSNFCFSSSIFRCSSAEVLFLYSGLCQSGTFDPTSFIFLTFFCSIYSFSDSYKASSGFQVKTYSLIGVPAVLSLTLEHVNPLKNGFNCWIAGVITSRSICPAL